MQAAGLPTRPMGELLLALERRGTGHGQPGHEVESPPRAAPGWADMLSTHPGLATRAESLRRGRLEGC